MKKVALRKVIGISIICVFLIFTTIVVLIRYNKVNEIDYRNTIISEVEYDLLSCEVENRNLATTSGKVVGTKKILCYSYEKEGQIISEEMELVENSYNQVFNSTDEQPKLVRTELYYKKIQEFFPPEEIYQEILN